VAERFGVAFYAKAGHDYQTREAIWRGRWTSFVAPLLFRLTQTFALAEDVFGALQARFIRPSPN
jgi:hypothetical protein